MWTKGKIEKAWRVFDKSMHVIADALEVDVLELKALILDGTVPPYDRNPVEGLADEEIAEMNRLANNYPEEEVPAFLPKRATLADLAPPAPAEVLAKAAPIIDKWQEFGAPPAKSRKHTPLAPPVSQPAHNAVRAVDEEIEANETALRPARRPSNLAPVSEDKRRANKPAEFYLMLGERYLHQSCEGLTDKPEHAWRQPEGKIAAVRRKFPETVDYVEVPAK